MQNKDYKKEFSLRLRECMIKQGYGSHTAVSGVSPAALSKATGCFNEMALRYLDGRSIPNPNILLKIAEWLKIDPGYLLFGELNNNYSDQYKMTIDKELLEYGLKKITPILQKTKNAASLLDFFMSILTDLSLMQIDMDQLKQVFDLALKSSIFHAKDDFMIGIKDHEQYRSSNVTS